MGNDVVLNFILGGDYESITSLVKWYAVCRLYVAMTSIQVCKVC